MGMRSPVGSPIPLSAEQRAAVVERTREVKALQWSGQDRPRKEKDRSMYGLKVDASEGEAAGFEVGKLLALTSAVGTVALFSYGMVKYLRLLYGDVYGGVRCASCEFRPIRTYWATAMASVGFLGVSLIVASRVLQNGYPSKWAYPMLKEWPKKKSEWSKKLVCLRYSLPYEACQTVVTVVLIVNFIFGVNTLALIDEPGDPMHLLYVHSGRKHHTRQSPGPDPDNPLGVDGKQLAFFHKTSLFAMWSLVLHGCIQILCRYRTQRTMFAPSLALAFDFVDAGCFFSIAYPRIFDSFGWTGSKVGGYSLFIWFGVFRFQRLRRFERFVTCLYSQSGFKAGFVNVNGPLVRFWALLVKLAVTLLTMSTLVCAIEFPCEPNAVRHGNTLEYERCHSEFKDFEQCVYFLVVTFSTVGYGDLAPATRKGRLLIIVIVGFIIATLPQLLADLRELADGDDVSAVDKTLASLGQTYEQVATMKKALGRIEANVQKEQQLAGGGATSINAPPSSHENDDDTELNNTTQKPLDDPNGDALVRKLTALKTRLDALEANRFRAASLSGGTTDPQPTVAEKLAELDARLGRIEHGDLTDDLCATFRTLSEVNARLRRRANLDDDPVGAEKQPPTSGRRVRAPPGYDALQVNTPLKLDPRTAQDLDTTTPFYLPSLSETLDRAAAAPADAPDLVGPYPQYRQQGPYSSSS